MRITEIGAEGRTVIVLSGRLDSFSAPGVETKLIALIVRGAVVADLTAVRYVSSAGLRVLLKAAKEARAAGVVFTVCGLQPAVQEMFESSGYDCLIPAFPSLEAALAG